MTEPARYILENDQGQVIRALTVKPMLESTSLQVIQRSDNRRVEILDCTDRYDQDGIEFKVLRTVGADEIQALASGAGITVKDIGILRVYAGETAVLRNEVLAAENSKAWRGAIATVALGAVAFLGMVFSRPLDNPKIEQELKQQVVQIVKRIQVRPQTVPATVSQNTTSQVQPVKTTTKTAAIKRMGALAVFGSMKNSAQKGGVNLGAVNTTAGPGLGGTAGSGGVQTSLYGKGLVAAPLGAGGNLEGGGGYGTKGKGGGQAGYGKLSLVGSAGSNPIPLGREAIIGGGLDRDLIADVINRNLGQVRFCYEQGLQGDPALAGRVAVDFTIGGNGQVRVAAVGSTTLNSKIVEDCILLRLKTWKFPLPEGGTDVKVSYPFVLRRTGQG